MIRSSYRQREGSFTVLGLGMLSMLIVPLLLVLSVASRSVVESNRAQGLSYAIAYSAVNRGVDSKFFTGNPNLQLYAPTDSPPSTEYVDEVNAFATELNAAYRATLEVAAPGALDTGGACPPSPGLCYTLVPQPTPDTAGPVLFPVGVHNIRPEPIGNQSSRTCSGISAADRHTLTCWVDGQARITGGAYTPLSTGHWTSGVEAEVGFAINFGGPINFLGGDTFRSTRTGVAIMGRPCQGGGNCAH